MKDQLSASKARRDFLSHHYFRERAVEFATKSGRIKMIDELERDSALFEQTNDQLDRELDVVLRKLGIDTAHLKNWTDRYIEDVYAGRVTE